MDRLMLEKKLIELAVIWGATYIPLPDEDWQDSTEVRCAGAGAGCEKWGEPNYGSDRDEYYCNGSPRCCP